MGTHACIAYETKDGWHGAYSHWDGYPACTGAQLLRCYSKRTDFEKLVDSGDMSWPDASQSYSSWPHCKSLGYDRKYFDECMKKWKVKHFDSIAELKQYADASAFADYIYCMPLNAKAIYVMSWRSIRHGTSEYSKPVRLRTLVTQKQVDASADAEASIKAMDKMMSNLRRK